MSAASTMAPTPDCCARNGLTYADGRRCSRHATMSDRSLVAELDAQAATIGIDASNPWPYGPNVDVPSRQAMLEWAGKRGLRLSPRGRCLRWLRRGRCVDTAYVACNETWHDHVTGWNRDGRAAVLVSQPYGISDGAVRELGSIAADASLYVNVSAHSWYGHGTVLIEVWREDAWLAYVTVGQP